MFRSFKHWILVLLSLTTSGFGLSACLPSLVPEPEPSPVVFHISITPTLNTLRPLLKNCITEQPEMSLIVSESPAPDLDQTSLAIQWGAYNLPGGYAAVLGEETMVFIVHPQNPLSSIPQADFNEIYHGTRQEWPDGGPDGEVQPWAYPDNADIQQIFAALGEEPALPGNVTALVPDPAAMLEEVSGSPTAIGFIPRRWIDDRVKIIQVEGLEESQLRQPILSTSKVEPEGQEKSWLLCLQAGLAE